VTVRRRPPITAGQGSGPTRSRGSILSGLQRGSAQIRCAAPVGGTARSKGVLQRGGPTDRVRDLTSPGYRVPREDRGQRSSAVVSRVAVPTGPAWSPGPRAGIFGSDPTPNGLASASVDGGDITMAQKPSTGRGTADGGAVPDDAARSAAGLDADDLRASLTALSRFSTTGGLGLRTCWCRWQPLRCRRSREPTGPV